MTTPQQPFQSLRGLPQRLSQHGLQHLSPRQRQYAMLGTLLVGGVAGVSIEQHNLRPGESTSVYVIRRGEAP